MDDVRRSRRKAVFNAVAETSLGNIGQSLKSNFQPFIGRRKRSVLSRYEIYSGGGPLDREANRTRVLALVIAGDGVRFPPDLP